MAVAFFAGLLFAAAFFAVRFTGGPAALRSASSSAARSRVIVAGSSPLRRDALVSPSVTYGPNRPSRRVIAPPLAGSTPISRNGSAARPWPRRCLGAAYSANASSSVTVNSWSSDASER